ncbi:MAG TPA: MarR family transcriptional regulator [Candidatus Ligilactobacillus excrementigallinarum]|uniref:MarR family transcriptional regulator n=1 Tax=Candidatus Ligilactobacillus excrementigallinarum TaxID=2838641 RepID=A0A9D1UWB6_9LACO|nr:MarR family transcriptional regulator [Candidatus Ligilactobacillus excrementigallinarum]
MKEPLDNLLDLQREYQRFIQKLAKQNKLTVAEWQLLQRISDGKNSQEILADEMQLDTSTLSRQLSKLTQKEYVSITKVDHPKKVRTRKSYRYRISELGKSVLTQMNSDFDEFGNQVFAQWSLEEKNFLKILINRLTQSMRRVKLN